MFLAKWGFLLFCHLNILFCFKNLQYLIVLQVQLYMFHISFTYLFILHFQSEMICLLIKGILRPDILIMLTMNRTTIFVLECFFFFFRISVIIIIIRYNVLRVDGTELPTFYFITNKTQMPHSPKRTSSQQ